MRTKLKSVSSVLALLVAVSAIGAGCAKTDDEDKKGDDKEKIASLTGISDKDLTSCLVGAWSFTDVSDNNKTTTYVLGADGTFIRATVEADPRFTYTSGTWSVEDGLLVTTDLKVGESTTSGTDAQSNHDAATEQSAEFREEIHVPVSCKGDAFSMDLYSGGDFDTLAGAWEKAGEKVYRLKDGASTLAKEKAAVLTMNATGDGVSYKETVTEYYDSNTSTWVDSATPSVSEYPVCSWSKTTTDLTVVLNPTACDGTTDATLSFGYEHVGDALVLSQFTRQ